MLKLKRKLQFRGHVRPELIQQVLNRLKVDNPLYKDILVILTILIGTSQLYQNDAEDNDTRQQATSNNIKTDSDLALEYDARENDK